jgi:serine phosphatase RsbU (regulator of sigma subunit)
VAGKGVPAALLMAKLSAEARYCMLAHEDPAQAVTALNEILLQFNTMDRFVTLVATLLDRSRHTVTVVNAGHMPPLVFRRAALALEEAVPQSLGGLPLGVIEGQTYAACQIELQPGDSLVLYTDGVTDALDVKGEPFGPEGVRRAVLDDSALAAAQYRPEQVGKQVIEAVRRHAAGRPQNDDIALVTFGRLDAGSSQFQVPPVSDAGRAAV